MPLQLPAERTAILRSDLFGGLAGALGDLQTPAKLSDPADNARDGAILLRLLEALDRGEVDLPDEEARARVEILADGHDETVGYGRVAAVHDAHHALLEVLGGACPGRRCPR